MNLAADHAAAPAAALSRGAAVRIGPECQAGRQLRVDQRAAGQAFQRDAEEDEIDVGIDRWTRVPYALKHEGTQGLRILTVRIERLDGRQMRVVGEALTEGEATLGCIHVVLAQIRNDLDQRIVEGDAAGFHVAQNARGGENHLGEGGEIEPCVGRERDRLGFDLREAGPPQGSFPLRGDKPEHRPRNARFRDGRAGGFEG